MRDPCAPIPPPAASAPFWRHPLAPPSPRDRARDYDPTRLVEAEGDLRGIDRRSQRRSALEPAAGEVEVDDAPGTEEGTGSTPACELEGAAQRLAGARRPVDAMLGLATSAGWALVRTICLAPGGLLIRVVDPCERGLDRGTRDRAIAALARLSPGPEGPSAGSMLATVGRCLLTPRVVADLAGWSAAHRPTPGASGTTRTRAHLSVTLVLPSPTPPHGRNHMCVGPLEGPAHGRSVHQFPGQLGPLNDPSEVALAVVMDAHHRERLAARLLGPRRRASVPASEVEALLLG